MNYETVRYILNSRCKILYFFYSRKSKISTNLIALIDCRKFHKILFLRKLNFWLWSKNVWKNYDLHLIDCTQPSDNRLLLSKCTYPIVLNWLHVTGCARNRQRTLPKWQTLLNFLTKVCEFFEDEKLSNIVVIPCYIMVKSNIAYYRGYELCHCSKVD